MGVLTSLFSSSGLQLPWRRVYADPAQKEGGKTLSRPQWYSLLWSYYTNEAFEQVPQWTNQWSAYKQAYRLYRQMRSIYNPTSRLVDFYSSSVYPGVLTLDGTQLPNGTAIAIPFDPSTPPELTRAVAETWRWSNWQANKGQMVRFAAATGNVLVEVVDDLDAGHVHYELVWPGWITSLDLSAAGVVQGYTLQYTCRDDDGRSYNYRKVVTPESFATFRDDQPFDYTGDGAVYANPYGFVPAVWVKHRELGGNFGAPAIHGSLGKIDELNSLASHVHDHIHRVIGSPTVFWAKGDVTKLAQQTKRPASTEFADPEMDRDTILMLKGPEGGKAESLIKELDIKGAMDGMDRLMQEIEADHPELATYRELRAMTQVTGPAAQRLLGDVVHAMSEAAANYDLASTRLFQMAVAIGGYRANSGAWGSDLTHQQQAFLPFDLGSYHRGDLDLTILPRPLVAPTQLELLQLQQLEMSLKAAAVQVQLQEREVIKD